MRMRFRKEGRGRGRAASMAAAVTVVTTLAWLVATAIPASAASTCTGSTSVLANDTLNLAIGADDHVLLAVGTGVAPFAGAAGEFNFSVNSGAFASCGAAVTTTVVDWVNVTGSDAGAETFTMFHPADWVNSGSTPNSSTTVDLGNGNDSLVVEYGALPFVTVPVIADPAAADTECLGSGTGGVLVGDQNCGGVADLRINDAESITINGGGGNDTLDAGNLSGILANDPVVAVLPAVVSGDDIPAAVNPFAANLTLNGGTGDDTLDSGDGNDNFQGGPGADTVDYSAASTGVTADLSAATGTGQGSDTLADVQNITGSAFDDTLTGNSLDNVISGGAGDDVIDGGTGNDTLSGGAGDDTFNEGATNNGHDTITGGSGSEVVGDTLNYGGRTAAVTINADSTPTSGESGELDTIGTDIENYITGSGSDTLVGSAGSEFFTPGSGTNSVDGGGGTDYLDMSTEAGPAVFNLSNNAGTGTAGTTVDTFKNTEGLIGTDGGDTLNWDGTGTLLDFIGGAGTDTVDASTSLVAVTVNLTAFTGGALNGTVENVIGGPGDDAITGNQLYNKLTGGAGADTLVGNDGNDTLDGGDGRDTITGGNGNDTVMGGAGDDTMNGGVGADSLVFDRAGHGVKVDNQLGFARGQGSDSIAFFEIVKGTDKHDVIIGGQTSFDANNRYFGFGGNDSLIGTNSTDVLNGGDGNDNIRGGNGDDILNGAAGNDKLYGSAGDDQLHGGSGIDWGWGGGGNDSCSSVEHQQSC